MRLIPKERLESADKILFIAHLAIGDYTYLQNFFKAFGAQNPHLKMDLWIEEERRTSDQSKWPALKKYSLYDWVEEADFFNRIYRDNYRPDLFEKAVEEAVAENYPIVVSLGIIRPHNYANLARRLSPNGFVIGMKREPKFYQWRHKMDYKKLNVNFAPFRPLDNNGKYHVSDEYADWFHQLSHLEVPIEERYPFVIIPDKWNGVVEKRIGDWGIDRDAGKIVFINAFAKNPKRCWTLDHVMRLIAKMKALPDWENTYFIINSMPEKFADVELLTKEAGLDHVYPFSAIDNFFELPAMLAQCDLIISVETAIMHLANAVHVPVIALMRLKTPEWVPIDQKNSTVIFNQKRWHRVNMISEDDVVAHLPPLSK